MIKFRVSKSVIEEYQVREMPEMSDDEFPIEFDNPYLGMEREGYYTRSLAQCKEILDDAEYQWEFVEMESQVRAAYKRLINTLQKKIREAEEEEQERRRRMLYGNTDDRCKWQPARMIVPAGSPGPKMLQRMFPLGEQ